jgi:four helix bundle protein
MAKGKRQKAEGRRQKAEGYGRQYKKEYINFLHFALGSLRELDTQLIIAKELEFAQSEHLNWTLNEVEEMQKILVSTLKKMKS